MKTSAQWWSETRDNPQRLTSWLHDQYRGEVTASARILGLRDRFTDEGTRAYKVLTVIARQERTHAAWVAELLEARGLSPNVHAGDDRYWRTVLPNLRDLETGAAIGAHAERMRLERIEVIATDPKAPLDIRRVFARILPEEHFHARAFAQLATPEALAATATSHALGREVLGLVA